MRWWWWWWWWTHLWEEDPPGPAHLSHPHRPPACFTQGLGYHPSLLVSKSASVRSLPSLMEAEARPRVSLLLRSEWLRVWVPGRFWMRHLLLPQIGDKSATASLIGDHRGWRELVGIIAHLGWRNLVSVSCLVSAPTTPEDSRSCTRVTIQVIYELNYLFYAPSSYWRHQNWSWSKPKKK